VITPSTDGAGAAFGDIPLIADTSVWAKLDTRTPEDRKQAFGQAVRDQLILGSPIVRLEYLHHLDGDEFDEFDRVYSALPRHLPVTEAVCHAALTAMRELKELGANSPRSHKVDLGDLLIAATAQEFAVNVLHDDTDFDHLARVLAFEPVRFLPEGELRPSSTP
jgi:predicted nucleic acid-binding protein